IDDGSVSKAKLDTAVQASLGKADTALQAHQDISGKENISNKTTTIAAQTTASDSKYPTEKAVATALAGKQNTLTAAQLNAANSGVTAAKVTAYDGYAAQIAAKATSTDITNAINALDVAASTEAGNVVTNVSQTDGKISVTRGTITVPTVNNATLTIKQGGVSKGTFTANQATAATIELTDNDTKYTASGSNGVSASVSGTVVNVAGTAATRDAVGVAKLGVIPVGTTGTATATIWVE
ncbi:MAG: hypothetical protein K2I81_03880, partial [Alphaproteobacteria bacterium]|nr:hypothetical protein [Alphaproteobacteria bacterium]